MNPLRYRGYCYDDETGLYYLNSRYYNPTWCRFISEDIAQIQAAAGNTVSGNLFAYCNNNPVMGNDPDGYISLQVAGYIIDGILLVLNIAIAVSGLKATIKLIQFFAKEAVRKTKKKIIAFVKPVLGKIMKAILGFVVPQVSAIAAYAVEVFMNWSLGYAIALAIYTFIPISHRILRK